VKALTTVLSLLGLLAAPAAAEDEQWYHVELIAFRYVEPVAAGSEQWVGGVWEPEVDGITVDLVEPPDPEHPLLAAWAADEPWVDHRLLLTPHSAFFTPESVYDMRFKGGEIAMAYLTEGRLQNCVNEAHLQGRR